MCKKHFHILIERRRLESVVNAVLSQIRNQSSCRRILQIFIDDCHYGVSITGKMIQYLQVISEWWLRIDRIWWPVCFKYVAGANMYGYF